MEVFTPVVVGAKKLSTWWVLLAAMLLGAALRLYHIETVEWQFDEGATQYFASLPWSDLWGPPALLETNPPFYYSLVWLVHQSGGTLEQMRYVSAGAGLLCVPVAWMLAERLAGRFAAAGAALLVATSAAQIGTSQLARGYSLLALAISSALLCLVAARQLHAQGEVLRVRVVAWWAGYAAVSLVALYTHNTAPVILAACNAAVLASLVGEGPKRWRFVRAWLATNIVVAAFYAFWIPVVLYQVGHVPNIAWIPRPNITDFRYQVMRVYGQRFITLGQPAVDLLFVAAMLLGLWHYRSSRLVVALAVGVIAGGPLLMFAVSQWVPLIHSETLLWSGPIALVFGALGCSALGKGRHWALPLLVVLQLGADVSAAHSHTDDWQQVDALLRADARPGDTIYVAGPATTMVLRHYGLPERDMDVRTIATGEAPWYRNFPGRIVAPADVVAQAVRRRRVWLVSRFWPKQHADIARQIETSLPLVLHYRSPSKGKGLELSLFVRPEP